VRIELLIPGPPTGKGRPRFANGRTYTDKGTQLAEARVQRAWEEVGSPRLHDGPLYLRIWIGVERPKGHYKRDGSLSTEGLRHPFPTRRPDLDNVVKLIADSLNGLAFHDDSQIVTVLADRSWSTDAQTVVSIDELTKDDAIPWESPPSLLDDPERQAA
jgi:Holliday junction resolvase RusA-like endonuclease